MRAVLLAGCIAAALLAVAPPASAQRNFNSRLLDKPAEVPDDGSVLREVAARQVMYRYAGCLIRASPQRVDIFLAAVPGTQQGATAGRMLATNRCLLTGSLKTNTDLLRVDLFQARYRERFGRSAPPDLTAAPAIDYTGGVHPPESSYVALRRFADCVTRTDTAGTRALVLSPIATAEEGARFAALNPAMGACLSPDNRLSFSRSVLRGLLAETLYRLTLVTTPGSVTP